MALVDLRGRTALVTGGGTRVGRSIARALGSAGCDVVVHYASNLAGAAAVVDEIQGLGQRSIAHRADLTDRAELERLGQDAIAFTGRLDVLVHNAANFERVAPCDLTPGAWDRALALNVTAPYLLTLTVAPWLRATHGSVIAVTCLSAARPWKNYLPYSASKAALANLVLGFAVSLAPEVRVNAVAPGTVLPPADYDEATLKRLREKVPLQRIGEAEDVARAVVFLAQNDYLTGQTITVDGGRSVGG